MLNKSDSHSNQSEYIDSTNQESTSNDAERKGGRATSNDVARLAGVSQSTVSRVFNTNWKGSVKKEARDRVLKAAAKLNYSPSTIAHIMTSKRSGIIGIIISKQFDLFYYNIMGILTTMLNDRGYQTMVFTSDPKKEISDLLTDMVRYQVDGVIITSSAVTHTLQQTKKYFDIPMVLLNGYVPRLQINAVCSDNFAGCIQMADYLVSVGHKRFAYITTSQSEYRNYMPRQEAFLYGLSMHGIHQCQIAEAGYDYESGAAAAKRLFQSDTYPDAIFCAADLGALGAVDAAKECGLKVGEEISVTGFDTPYVMQLPSYDLTVLKQNVHQLSQDAIEVLLQAIEHPSTVPTLITRPMELVIRSSSRKCSPKNI